MHDQHLKRKFKYTEKSVVVANQPLLMINTRGIIIVSVIIEMSKGIASKLYHNNLYLKSKYSKILVFNIFWLCSSLQEYLIWDNSFNNCKQMDFVKNTVLWGFNSTPYYMWLYLCSVSTLNSYDKLTTMIIY